jgi:fructosamine-3-kinase
MEQLLKKKIDPFLTVENLSLIGSRASGREIRAKSAGILSGGCWNRVIEVSFENDEPDLVYKINPNREDKRLIREYGVLEYFQRNTEMPVPTPYLLDSSGEIIPGSTLVMQKIPGRVMHHIIGMLNRKAQEAVTEQIAHYVVGLHKTRSTGFGGVELPEQKRVENWAEFWLPRFDNVYEDISGKKIVSDQFLRAVARVREHFTRMLDIGRGSTLTNYDIWSGNVIIDFNQDEPYISGFIDIPGFWADYARELSFMEMFGVADRRLYRIYFTDYDRDPGFNLRKNIYNLKMHMKHIIMYPNEYYYRQGAETCLHVIEQAI